MSAALTAIELQSPREHRGVQFTRFEPESKAGTDYDWVASTGRDRRAVGHFNNDVASRGCKRQQLAGRIDEQRRAVPLRMNGLGPEFLARQAIEGSDLAFFKCRPGDSLGDEVAAVRSRFQAEHVPLEIRDLRQRLLGVGPEQVADAADTWVVARMGIAKGAELAALGFDAEGQKFAGRMEGQSIFQSRGQGPGAQFPPGFDIPKPCVSLGDVAGGERKLFAIGTKNDRRIVREIALGDVEEVKQSSRAQFPDAHLPVVGEPGQQFAVGGQANLRLPCAPQAAQRQQAPPVFHCEHFHGASLDESLAAADCQLPAIGENATAVVVLCGARLRRNRPVGHVPQSRSTSARRARVAPSGLKARV